jgi:murein tripeptide amidase MpaA
VVAQPRRSGEVVRRECLCATSGGHPCDLLTVTDFSSSEAEVAARRVVVLSARVHPGETNASWMMNGLIEAVTDDSAEAVALRQAVVLRIVPMLNPDGVVLGNYRCGMAGVDLNRQWQVRIRQCRPARRAAASPPC